MSKIYSVCGFSGYSDTTEMLGSTVTKAHKDNVMGYSCRCVLDDLSAACGGCWICSGDTGSSDSPSGVLVLTAPDKYTGSVLSPDKYSAVKLGGTHRFTGIVLTNGDKTYTAGDTATLYNSFEADTPYASAQAAGDLYPAPPALLTFGDRQLTANHCTLDLTASGMYASIGGNAVSEDGAQYLNKTTREIKERYRLGDVMNNVKVSKEGGITYVYENKNSGEKKEYGFNVGEDGTVKFDGVMMDGKMPDRIEKVSDTSRAVYYGNKSYLLSWEVDGEGNRVNFKMEEAGHKVNTDTKEENT